MSGFGKKSKVNLEVEFNKQGVDQLIKDYKKIKRYQRSNFYTIKVIDGTEEIISELIKEYEKNPIE